MIARRIMLTAAAMLIIGSAGLLSAEDEWIVHGSEFWSNPADWNTSHVPNSSVDEALFASSGDGDVFVDLNISLRKMTFNYDMTYNNDTTYRIRPVANNGVTLTSGPVIEVDQGSHEIAAPMRLADNATVNIIDGFLKISGDVDEAGGPMSLTKNLGSLWFTGNGTYTGATTLNSGLTWVDGSLVSPTVVNGGVLGGIGHINASVVVMGGVLAPGTVPGGQNIGTLYTHDLTLTAQSVLQAELGGSSADCVSVTGEVTLLNSSFGNSVLDLVLTAPPVAGQVYPLILNDGGDPVVGIFSDTNANPLPNGSLITLGANDFMIRYDYNFEGNGVGIGNDVVLASVPEPSTLALLLISVAGFLLMTKRRIAINIRRIPCALVMVALIILGWGAGASRAEFIQLFNTGVADDGTPLPDGTVGDPHYSLISVANGSVSTIRVRRGTNAPLPPSGPWIADDSRSDWIGANNGYYLLSPNGNYAYRTTFTLSAAQMVDIFGNWAADDVGTDIQFNGASTGNNTGISGFTQWHPFHISGMGVAGANHLDFLVTNTSNYSGLRVEFTSVPEPSVLILLGMGFIGALGAHRKNPRVKTR
jgi:hypothetical protein